MPYRPGLLLGLWPGSVFVNRSLEGMVYTSLCEKGPCFPEHWATHSSLSLARYSQRTRTIWLFLWNLRTHISHCLPFSASFSSSSPNWKVTVGNMNVCLPDPLRGRIVAPVLGCCQWMASTSQTLEGQPEPRRAASPNLMLCPGQPPSK